MRFVSSGEKLTPLPMVYEYILGLDELPELKAALEAENAWAEKHGPEAFPGEHEDYPWWAGHKVNKFWLRLSESYGAADNVRAQRAANWLHKSYRLGRISDFRSDEALELLARHSSGEIDFRSKK